MMGYVPADGSGNNGVLVVLEAAGADEAEVGRPTVGKAGHYLWQQLARVNLNRDDFRIHNVLSCQPPGNKLVGMPYEMDAVNHCSPNLDRTIADHKAHCTKIGKTPVILALGKSAFRRIMGLGDKHPLLFEDYQCYPHWNAAYSCWVIAADHPSYLMRGYNHLVPVLQFAATRAVELAKDGHRDYAHTYQLDPGPNSLASWAREYFRTLAEHRDETFLSFDIETPYKRGVSEEGLEGDDEAVEDNTILRISFAYKPGEAISIPWDSAHLPIIQDIFASDGVKMGWNNAGFDDRKIRANGVEINGQSLDAMLAWHVLNSSLPKSLGFVTPFYVQNTGMWKHLSDSEPAFYNAKDADMALHCFLGIRRDLMKSGLWEIFNRHVMELNKALGYMSAKGVILDADFRTESETKLAGLLAGVQEQMEAVVPFEARKLKVYKKTPKETVDLVQVDGTKKVTQCPVCLATEVKADHFKSIGKKRLKAGEAENPCHGSKSEKVEITTVLWAERQPFKISKLSLTNYQDVVGHTPITDRKEGKVTFNDNALKLLIKKYPNDPLYPIIGDYREIQKLLSTYVGVTDPLTGKIRGGMPTGPDGRIHTTFSHNPSTLRLASQNPNLQNLPRPSKDKAALGNIIRNLVVPAPGHIFLARDFSGIEAVLVGYEAQSPEYIRLAKRDVHTFYTLYALYGLGDDRVRSEDLPQLSWDDDKLFAHLEHWKKEVSEDRNALYKHLTHAINFGQGAKGAQEKILKETNTVHPVQKITKVMDIYRDLFPAIPKWQRAVQEQADRDGYLRNAFGYIHRFNRVFSWKKDFGTWVREPGDDAQKVLAFKPQSTAAGIIKEAILRLYFDRFDEAGQHLRLQVHDEIFTEPPIEYADTLDAILQDEMERPVPCLRMPASWGMGDCLSIGSESKRGTRWGTMK
jgi:uracil-DNA glycosylase family 4